LTFQACSKTCSSNTVPRSPAARRGRRGDTGGDSLDVVDAAARDRWVLGPESHRHPPVSSRPCRTRRRRVAAAQTVNLARDFADQSVAVAGMYDRRLLKVTFGGPGSDPPPNPAVYGIKSGAAARPPLVRRQRRPFPLSGPAGARRANQGGEPQFSQLNWPATATAHAVLPRLPIVWLASRAIGWRGAPAPTRSRLPFRDPRKPAEYLKYVKLSHREAAERGAEQHSCS